MIKQLTNFNVSTIISTFASLYEKKCWLTTHTDQSYGKIAFVYNLTKNWKEEYGGNFYLLHDNHTVRKKVIPTFNSLTIFDVSRQEGRPHYVEKVNDNVEEKRLCFSGWLI